jgi:tripartite-type tricarboxylate transporter receptor subunit TctC
MASPVRYSLKLLVAQTLAALCLFLAGAVMAQPYPDRPVTIVVPFPAGNSSDVAVRLIGNELQPALGQPVVIDNRAGAGGSIGAAFAARRPADGYTLLVGTPGPMAISPALRKGLSYDPLKSFEPVAPVAFVPLVLVVAADSPSKDLRALLKAAKESPNALTFASSGVGSTQHLVMASLAARSGVRMMHVPFQGSGAAATAIIGGQVQVMADILSAVLPLIKSGRLVPIAVTSKHRLEALPGVPTVAEHGIKGFDMQSWLMLYAPAGTPQDVIHRLNADIGRALQSPKVKKAFEDYAMVPMPIAYGNLNEFVSQEVRNWRAAVDVSGATVE